MGFELTPEEAMIERFVHDLAGRFGHAEWMAAAERGEFPRPLWDALAEGGYLGTLIPEEYGGTGLGMREMTVLLEALGGEGMALLLMIVSTVMASIALARHGTEEQKRRYLPEMARGTRRFCFAITEPNAGSNSFRIETLARRDGDGYRISGQKVFISGANEAQHVLLVARTTPYSEVADKRQGLSLFIVDTDAPGFEMHVQNTGILAAEKQFSLFFDDVRVGREALLGPEGAGILLLFDILNPERISGAAIATGLGRFVLSRAVAYACERRVFDVPIGAHQGLQHPMAIARTHLELASLMTRKAAWKFDRGENAGPEANMAKLAAADAALEACDLAIEVHGGNGFTREYGVLTLWPMIRLIKTAPVSREMILNYIGEHVLGLPRSY